MKKGSCVTLSVLIVVNNFASLEVSMNVMFVLCVNIEMDEDGCWFV